MGTTPKAEESVQGTLTETKPRAKTASFTAEQVRAMSKDEKLAELVAQQIDASEGNLKGTMAFQVAKMLQKQLTIEVK